MIFICFYLTQLIFNEKDGKVSESVLELAKRTERLVRFVINYQNKSSKKPTEDILALQISAEKQARKVFNKFYLNI